MYTGSKYTVAVENVSQLIKNSDTETKIRALHCFAGLMSIDKDPAVSKSSPVDHRVTLMTREWYRTLDSKPMETLFDICKNPFPDIKQAAFTLLDAICQHQWGEEMVARVAGIYSCSHIILTAMAFSSNCNSRRSFVWLYVGTMQDTLIPHSTIRIIV